MAQRDEHQPKTGQSQTRPELHLGRPAGTTDEDLIQFAAEMFESIQGRPMTEQEWAELRAEVRADP